LEFLIIGAHPTKRVKALSANPGVKVLGFVDDPYALISQSKLFVSPQLIGAGIQNKVLRAMALGKTVVGTHKALRGINGQDGRHFVQADTTEEIVEKTLELLHNTDRRAQIGQNARKLIQDQYTWKKIGDDLLAHVGEVINAST
jgi:glycosyltransferase involved in cell wall biosynthesis